MKGAAFLAILGLTGLEPGPADFSGSFDRAPVVTWVLPLPSPPVNAGSHTELGRPVLHGQWIFVGTAGENSLLVLDRRNGDVVARLPTGGPVQSAAVFVGERLWFSDAAGYTYCYDLDAALNGAGPRWKHHAGSPLVSSPSVVGDRLYLTNVEDQTVALDAERGSLVWRHAWRRDSSRSTELILYGKPSPVVVGGLVLVGTADGTLVALGIDEGDVVWQRRVGEGKYPDVVGAPVVVGDRIVVGGYAEPLVALDLATREVRWRLDIGGVSAVVPDPTRPAVVYHGSSDGKLRRIDVRTGEVAWTWDSGDSGALNEPVPTPAGIMVSSATGVVYLIDADSGARTWRLNLGLTVSGVSTAPAVDGRQAVALTDAGNLVNLISPRPPLTLSR